MRFSNDEETAKDVVQEAFIKALLQKDVMKYMETGKIKSWIYTTSKNLLLDKKRREQNYKSILEQNFFYNENSDFFDANEFTHMDNKSAIMDAIANLSQIYSEVITLKYFNDLNSSEISERLNIPSSTVRSRLQKAIELLKKDLK